MTRDGSALPGFARAAVAAALAGSPEPPPPAAGTGTREWLEATGASFVTLRLGGELRGCLGTLRPWRPLIEDVRSNALAAAFEDPRFEPLTAAELPAVRFEVSVLSPLEPIAVDSDAELLAALRPHEDGLLLEHGGRRATFLPQVWELLPEPADFLRRLKQKAGIDPTAGAPAVRYQRFAVDEWEEEENGG